MSLAPSPGFTPIAPLSYAAVRARACRQAARAFVARWGVYALIAALVAGAGADAASGAAAVAALAGWVVLPLFWCVSQGWAWGVPATLLQGALGAALLWGLRQIIWPECWAEAERALPLLPQDIRRADLRWLGMVALPWVLLMGTGAGVWLVTTPPWLKGHQAAAVLAWLMAMALMLALGVAMQAARRGAPPRRQSARAPAPALTGHTGPVRVSRALLLWPLWRGPARRTAQTAAAGSALLLALAAFGLATPAWAPWWLAAQALCGQVLVSRLNLLSQLELGPLLQGCAPLPLAPQGLQRLRRVACLIPAGAAHGLMALALLLVVPSQQLRPAVLLAWWLCCSAAESMDIQMQHRDAGAKAARWLFMLVLSACIGSEVLR
jgi:hypothetical protein